jgi:hypothetical protein
LSLLEKLVILLRRACSRLRGLARDGLEAECEEDRKRAEPDDALQAWPFVVT